MSNLDFSAPEYYLNRELSWLEFNDRVLREGLAEDVPLLERLKFLSIVSSNLDEFFMIRVAGLAQQRAAGVRRRDPSGLTPAQQLTRISQRVHRMVADQAEGIRAALAQLRPAGLAVLEPAEWTPAQRRFIRDTFAAEVQPVLTPLAMQELDPSPLLPDRALNVAVLLGAAPASPGHQDDAEAAPQVLVVPVPRCFPRFLAVPASGAGVALVRLEDVMAAHSEAVAGARPVLATAVFRITRDADVPIQDDDAADLLHAVEEAVLSRRRRAVVRLEISADPDARIRRWAVQWLRLRPEDVYETAGLLDATALMELAGRQGFDQLRVPDWPPQTPRDLLDQPDLWRALQDRDVLLFHPYESFDPVVQLLQQAAEDPGVLAIKQTLYRTSGDSPIIRALQRAATSGKQVTVLVELKARFDEARNVGWARRLEDAGCTVIYGIAGYKTHSKAVLVLRREAAGLRRYIHLGTGNYNDRTARLYSDIGLLTSDHEIATDVAAFFNLLTGCSETVGWSKLAIAPTDLRRRFTDLIEREAQASSPDRPGLIMVKVNSLQDRGIIKALYRASRAGVRILLNVRGICCLRPGVKGASETIEVRSIVDRFLEHARVFYFRNGGHEEVYLSSADWMGRNLDRRLEMLFPVQDAALRRRLVGILETFFQDNVKARRLRPDGTYEPVPRDGPAVRAQEQFYREAVQAARSARESGVRFRPLVRPESPEKESP
jgi:polyphosphate kinase